MDPQMQELARTLASLTDEEYAAVTEEARGPETPKGVHVPGMGNSPSISIPGPEDFPGQIRALRRPVTETPLAPKAGWLLQPRNPNQH
jgi:hypothetical protein